MSQPTQHRLERVHLSSGQGIRALNHQDRQLQLARGQQLGSSPLTPRILAHQSLNAMRLQQGQFIGQNKRTPRQHRMLVGHIQGRRQRFDQAQQVMMLGLRHKMRQLQPTQCQKHTLGRASQSSHRTGHVSDGVPIIAHLRLPGRTRVGQQRHSQLRASGHCMLTDLRCKGMGGINNMADLSLLQVSHQASTATKSADSGGYGLRRQCLHPTGIAKDHRITQLGQPVRQLRRFSATTKNQDFCHDAE